MIESSIARRYAKALFEIAKESNQLEGFLKELKAFARLTLEDGALLDTLSNRYMDLSARLRIVEELMARLGGSKIVTNFLKLLIKKGRISLLDLMVRAYQGYVFEEQGKLEAVITSAKKLKEVHYQEIQNILSNITGKTIVMQPMIKPEVLGGLAIRMGGEVFDGTLRAHLDKLCLEMKKIAV